MNRERDTMTNTILENRRLWVEALKNASGKAVGQLETANGERDFIGVACDLFVPETKTIRRNEVHYDGNFAAAPKGIYDALGLNPEYELTSNEGYYYADEYYYDLYNLHDNSEITLAEIAEILEREIAGNEDGFFIPVK